MKSLFEFVYIYWLITILISLLRQLWSFCGCFVFLMSLPNLFYMGCFQFMGLFYVDSFNSTAPTI